SAAGRWTRAVVGGRSGPERLRIDRQILSLAKRNNPRLGSLDILQFSGEYVTLRLRHCDGGGDVLERREGHGESEGSGPCSCEAQDGEWKHDDESPSSERTTKRKRRPSRALGRC